jgi:hypothetical protein
LKCPKWNFQNPLRPFGRLGYFASSIVRVFLFSELCGFSYMLRANSSTINSEVKENIVEVTLLVSVGLSEILLIFHSL